MTVSAQTYWLLEKVGDDRPYYFTVYLGHLTFSADANDAIQFARQQDAEAIGAEMFDGQHVAAREFSARGAATA